MADIFWQELLCGSPNTLPRNCYTEHFSRDELQTLLNSWGGGNTLQDPKSIGQLAEHVYTTFNSSEEFCADPNIQQMWRDGLGRFLQTLWKMIENKKNVI